MNRQYSYPVGIAVYDRVDAFGEPPHVFDGPHPDKLDAIADLEDRNLLTGPDAERFSNLARNDYLVFRGYGHNGHRIAMPLSMLMPK
jgi:hypothetical protein